ncbi:acetylglutamate kinase [Aureibacillus halotolerans]|uniref:Acetylglutamate kinase n=1 Tax=Aureibacillus halotolerans TaxID=1508390 RepID=A0A4R6U8H4_9BACI|nr:acetylglutamate kinase [Aureibacillus halotolerans]TDQ42106.1 N-acetylglutamate kinase [Aureibacillus halotolerans]
MTRPIVVLKCGGSTLEQLSDSFFEGLRALQEQGKQPVIVHGGGPDIQSMLQQLDIKTEFHDGLRKTTEPVMNVVEMVLAGSVNKRLVTRLRSFGVDAAGLSGCDGGLLECKPISLETLGLVGEVTHVTTNVLEALFLKGIVPVIAPIGVDKEGVHYNINADTAAAAVANALHAEQLMFVTDVPGILKDDKLIQELSISECEALISDGTIYGGMLPKVRAALATLNDRLQQVAIVNGAMKQNNGCIRGTTIKRSLEVV